MATVSSDGKIDFVSDNVFDYLGFKQDSLTEHVIYNFIHHGDHARFSVNLEPNSWKTWKKLPQSAATGKQTGFDRSKVFNLRFLQNNDAKAESLDDRYENMQVSFQMVTANKVYGKNITVKLLLNIEYFLMKLQDR